MIGPAAKPLYELLLTISLAACSPGELGDCDVKMKFAYPELFTGRVICEGHLNNEAKRLFTDGFSLNGELRFPIAIAGGCVKN